LCQKDPNLIDVGSNNRFPFSWNDACPLELLVVSNMSRAQTTEGDIFFPNGSSAQVINLINRVYRLLGEETLISGFGGADKSIMLTS